MANKFSVMRVISSHAVLQADCGNTIYGTADAGSETRLEITGGTTLTALADENGRWEIVLPPFAASREAYAFTFTNGGAELRFDDILFGDLFHISGQSNMELPMFRTTDPLAPEEFPSCGYIREFRVPVECRFGKDDVCEDFTGGEWKTAVPENVPEMSAAGFWFAYEIYNKYKIPVGLLNTSAGGAPIEGRLPYKMLSELGWYDDFLKECTADGYMERVTSGDAERAAKRTERLDSLDGISGAIFGDSVRFTECTVPLDFDESEELRGFCGRIWFRKSFAIPGDADLSDAVLILGAITDADVTYVNGELVGETTYMYPPRIYPVPAGTLRHGTNTVHVRVDVQCARGGFTKGKDYCLKLRDRLIPLSGAWEYATAAKIPWENGGTFFPGLPLGVYGAMTAPAFRIRCRALLWYQGESNCNHPDRYAFLFRKTVAFFRERYGYDIPVITTQLCNYDDPFAGGSDCSARLRQAQLECLAVPGTDMAVTIDAGEDNDLHPRDKKTVGKRLALCAMRLLYGDTDIKPAVYCESAVCSGAGRVLLGFTDNSRVRLDGSRPDMFNIITASGKLPAQSAELTENGVLLTFAPGTLPEKVRCEWSNAPEAVVLRDDAGIPISPFEINIGKEII